MTTTVFLNNRRYDRLVTFHRTASLEEPFTWMELRIGIVFFTKSNVQDSITAGYDGAISTEVVWYAFAHQAWLKIEKRIEFGFVSRVVADVTYVVCFDISKFRQSSLDQDAFRDLLSGLILYVQVI